MELAGLAGNALGDDLGVLLIRIDMVGSLTDRSNNLGGGFGH
jgi:hypothetical protein